jgi:hypothetical protein
MLQFLLDKLSTSIRGLIRRVTITPQGVEQPTVLLHNIRVIISSFAVILQFSSSPPPSIHKFPIFKFHDYFSLMFSQSTSTFMTFSRMPSYSSFAKGMLSSPKQSALHRLFVFMDLIV